MQLSPLYMLVSILFLLPLAARYAHFQSKSVSEVCDVWSIFYCISKAFDFQAIVTLFTYGPVSTDPYQQDASQLLSWAEH